MNYTKIIKFKTSDEFDINKIIFLQEAYPNYRIIVEIPNTKNITSNMIKNLDSNVYFKVFGAYDEERIRRHSKGNEELYRYYYKWSIYSKNETVKILEEIEKIESGLKSTWSDIQKIVYIYEYLKSRIMYDPQYETKPSQETRSLRGLITRQSVCAGYSVIFKEILDRLGIECEYVEGKSSKWKDTKHAWNIVNINGKKYPFDITLDNIRFRAGRFYSLIWLGTDIKTFSKTHIPDPEEKTQNYLKTLSSIDYNFIRSIYSQIGLDRNRDYLSSTYYVDNKKNNTSYLISQIGDKSFNKKRYYRYFFAQLKDDDSTYLPLILYSDVNLSLLVDAKDFKRNIPEGYESKVFNILFSSENITDSLKRNTYYIGGIVKKSLSNKIKYIDSVSDIPKPKKECELFTFPTRVYKRSDNTRFIVQKMNDDNPLVINGSNVFSYDVFELVGEGRNRCLKRNTIYTERDFFNDKRRVITDEFLSRERLDFASQTTGGYMGYIDANNMQVYNPILANFFETSKKVDFESESKTSIDKNDMSQIPKFKELKNLVLKYELVPNDNGNYIVKDRKTKRIIRDKVLKDKAIFANIWLTSAGVVYTADEERPGFMQAFNKESEDFYNTICRELSYQVRNNKVIDTINLYRDITYSNNYKYGREIIVNLFKDVFQTEFINDYFKKSLGIDEDIKAPDVLYNQNYASELAFTTDFIKK